MKTAFEFSTAGRIVFGPGASDRVRELAQTFGDRALLVTGAHPERLPGSITGAAAGTIRIEGEPTFETITEALAEVRTLEPNVVIAAGGGSVLDAAKSLAMLARNPGAPLDYAEVIGAGQPIAHPGLPVLAIPTTAGTGSEVTKNAVLKSAAHGVKVSLRDASMLPTVAVVDPALTLGLPPALTAATGMDALCQCIEPFLSCRANPMTDALSRDGIRLAAGALVRAFRNGGDLGARADLSLAALYSGISLANAGLGAAHAFAAPIGGRFDAPHGAVCAALLPWAMTENAAEAVAQRRTDILDRMREVARLLTGRDNASLEDGIAWLHGVRQDLGIPGLGAYGINEKDIGQLTEAAQRSSSMKGNPLPLPDARMQALLAGALRS